jgi:hypothetical protein
MGAGAGVVGAGVAGGAGGAPQVWLAIVQTSPVGQLASAVHSTHTPALQTFNAPSRLQSALAVQATHVPAVPHFDAAGSVHGSLLPSTHAQPPLGSPSQFESSPATVQESAAAGPTEPEQVLKAAVALFAPATHSC